jgi:hypothetical protein
VLLMSRPEQSRLRPLLGAWTAPIIATEEVAERAGAPVTFKRDGHFNALGHTTLSDILRPVVGSVLKPR